MDAEDEDDYVEIAELEPKIEQLQTQLNLQGADPKKISKSDRQDLVTFIRAPDDDEDKTANDARARIRNRATGIRAYCIASCMAGDTAAVRQCESITCHLYPFRMGKDPLRGYDIKAGLAEATEEYEDDFEDSDEDDQDAN